MGEGLQRVAKACGGLTVKTAGGEARELSYAVAEREFDEMKERVRGEIDKVRKKFQG